MTATKLSPDMACDRCPNPKGEIVCILNLAGVRVCICRSCAALLAAREFFFDTPREGR